MNDAVEKITEEISRKGPMPFARFMELALYCPECGYYEKEKDNVGRRGDFFTSVSVGSLFGELLAFQFAEWLQPSVVSGQSSVGRIIEAGAHDGRFACDVLNWLRERRSDVFNRIEYWIVESSACRQEWQRERLADFAATVRWAPEITALDNTLQSSRAIIFSNELLDAMPVQRFGWDASAKRWFEWGVALENGRLVWSRMTMVGDHGSHFTFDGIDFEKLSSVLPDGFIVETSPAAERWWREAARVLNDGKLLTIDYGLRAEEYFVPERAGGTLRAYRAHRLSDDVLANPGEQDITAHVNFSAVQSAGEAAGLKTDLFVSQAKFLTGIAEQTWKRPDVFGEWTAARTRQFQTLTHPEHIGRPFRVLVQSRQASD